MELLGIRLFYLVELLDERGEKRYGSDAPTMLMHGEIHLAK